MDLDARLRRTRYRAWHRGTREADFLVGGFFDVCHGGWGEAELDWFEALLEEQDVDIIAWAIGATAPPERFAGPMMERMRQVDYIDCTREQPSPLQGRAAANVRSVRGTDLPPHGMPPQAARRGGDGRS